MRTRNILILAALLVGTSMTFAQGNTSSEGSEVSEATGIINGHEYVDLGLRVKWARCNIGTTSPTGYGNYYAWGETSTKSEYTEENCSTNGKSMGDIAGDSHYDVARANWGGTWRLPTASEIDELIDKCKREWTTLGNHKGYKVTGPNGNSIFLPAAGWRVGPSFRYQGEDGFYWSSTPYEDSTNEAYYLHLGSGKFYNVWNDKDIGRNVRPVSE